MEEHEAMKLIAIEHNQACSTSSSFVSHHEGIAIIMEAMDDLWAEIKMQDYPGRRTHIRSKAAYVAAMALRFLTNLC